MGVRAPAVRDCGELACERVPQDSQRARSCPDHWLSLLMARKPNRYQTKVEFFETLMLNLALHGNAYAKITKVGGQIRSIVAALDGIANRDKATARWLGGAPVPRGWQRRCAVF
ncbi:MAG: phage portal protein [Burkholderiales bacterium]|nr:phage portal protein [Burkholderiales bacterium]